jgi:enamine deaminase RidA (YjgF/YER057c/UK114 family)
MNRLSIIFMAVAATLPATAANAGARQQALVVMPEDPQQRKFQESVGWANAVVSNGEVHVSGVPAYLAAGETDVEKAYERAFEHIGKTLERAGASWDDVISITTYHIDPKAQIDAFAKVKSRFVKSPPPAWSAVGTTALLQPGALVEIEVIAHLPEKRAK